VSRRFLLDVNALVGLLWSVHSLHGRANAWFARESPQVLGCAFTELSFIRVSMADRTIGATFTDAERALAEFVTALGRRYRFIDHLPPAAVLRGRDVGTHKQVNDLYLCELASTHGARLATLDAGIKHPSALLIA
jgi:predicted nucleic acid-binding protein